MIYFYFFWLIACLFSYFRVSNCLICYRFFPPRVSFGQISHFIGKFYSVSYFYSFFVSITHSSSAYLLLVKHLFNQEVKLLVKQSVFISCVNLSCCVPVVGESGWRGAIIICRHWVKENLLLKNPARSLNSPPTVREKFPRIFSLRKLIGRQLLKVWSVHCSTLRLRIVTGKPPRFLWWPLCSCACSVRT